MEVAVSQRYLSPSRVDQRQKEKRGEARDKLIKRNKKQNCVVKHGRGRGKKKIGNNAERILVVEGMTGESSGVRHIGHDLTLMNAHVLPEVIVTTKVLPASFDRTLVRYEDDIAQKSAPEKSKVKKKRRLTLLVGVDRSHMPL
jgi:hypothetical protein